MKREAVVTGIGVVAPGGIGATAFWDLLTAGRTATRGITLFDPAGYRSRIAAEVESDPERPSPVHSVRRPKSSGEMLSRNSRNASTWSSCSSGMGIPASSITSSCA